MLSATIFQRRRLLEIFLFGLFLVFGLLRVDDYGLGWDEQFDRIANGRTVYNFVFEGKEQEYLNCGEKYHGPAIQFAFYTLEKNFGLYDSRTIHLFRHSLTFLLFFVAVIAFYRMMRLQFIDDIPVWLGTLLFVCSPRIFADAFYNSKDLGFVSVFTIAMYASFRWLNYRTVSSLILAAILAGFLIGVRITGVVLPCIAASAMLVRVLLERDKIALLEAVFNVALFGVVTAASTIFFWPILWLGPITHFHAAWIEMSHYGWLSTTLFDGKMVPSDQLPWNYLPVWMGITIPLTHLILFSIGCILLLWRVFKGTAGWSDKEWLGFYAVGLFFAPALAVILLHSVLYDGWRHLFFLHVPMVVICTYTIHSLNTLFQRKKWLVPVLTLASLIPVLVRMWVLHPYEHLYFNRLAGNGLKDTMFRYEMDYWGLSNRKLLEQVLEKDPRGTVRIKPENFPTWFNEEILPAHQRSRLIFVDSENDADYFIGFYRWRTSLYDDREEVTSVWVDSVRVATCFKAKREGQ